MCLVDVEKEALNSPKSLKQSQFTPSHTTTKSTHSAQSSSKCYPTKINSHTVVISPGRFLLRYHCQRRLGIFKVRFCLISIGTMTRGNQREKDRERSQARTGKKGPKKDDGLTPEQRRERDAKALQEKTAKKAGQPSGGGGGGGGGTSTKK